MSATSMSRTSPSLAAIVRNFGRGKLPLRTYGRKSLMELRKRRDRTRMSCTPSGSFQFSAASRCRHIALICARSTNGIILSAGAPQSRPRILAFAMKSGWGNESIRRALQCGATTEHKPAFEDFFKQRTPLFGRKDFAVAIGGGQQFYLHDPAIAKAAQVTDARIMTVIERIGDAQNRR